MTCKWLITMVIVSPLTGVIPLPNDLNGSKYGLLQECPLFAKDLTLTYPLQKQGTNKGV